MKGGLDSKILVRAILLFAVVAALHAAAVALYVYWAQPWFDNVMHFLGGAWAGLVGLWVKYRFRNGRLGRQGDVRVALAATLVIGAAWELYEYLTGYTFVRDDYAMDTIKDFAMDFAGALVSAVYVSRLNLRTA